MGKDGFKLGAFSSIMNKNIRFNPRPWADREPVTTKKFNTEKQSFINLHLEVIKEVDALIARNEAETQSKKFGLTTTKNIEKNFGINSFRNK